MTFGQFSRRSSLLPHIISDAGKAGARESTVDDDFSGFWRFVVVLFCNSETIIVTARRKLTKDGEAMVQSRQRWRSDGFLFRKACLRLRAHRETRLTGVSPSGVQGLVQG